MSRRKTVWVKKIIQVTKDGSHFDKIIPHHYVRGNGTWLRGGEPPAHEGSEVTSPISERKDKLIRNWAAKLGKTK